MEIPVEKLAWGSQQRCCYRNPDLHDEDVPEIDLSSPLAPAAAANSECLPILVAGDQNAGKSTFLHSFCNANDAGFLRLTSFLPILSSEFVNLRILRGSERAMDELPFLDTDVARGIFSLTLENFAFFCNEFGLQSLVVDGSGNLRFRDDTRFVALEFLEIGGDHLDRLVSFSSSSNTDTNEAVVDLLDVVLEEVLLRSLALVRHARRLAYFINMSTLLDPDSNRVNAGSLRLLLDRLSFLYEQLTQHTGDTDDSGEISLVVYCSRLADGGNTQSFDVDQAWQTLEEITGKKTERREYDASQEAATDAKCATPFSEEFGEAYQTILASEGGRLRQHKTVIGWLAAALQTALPCFKLRGVYPTHNLEEDGSMSTVSVLRSVVRLLDANMLISKQRQRSVQNRSCSASSSCPDSVSQKVVERVLSCAVELRGGSDHAGAGLHLWVTRDEFCDFVEEREEGVLPEVELGLSWGRVAPRLVESGACVPLHPSGKCADISILLQFDSSSPPKDLLRLAPGWQRDERISTTRDVVCVGFPRHSRLFECVTGPVGHHAASVGPESCLMMSVSGGKMLREIAADLTDKLLKKVAELPLDWEEYDEMLQEVFQLASDLWTALRLHTAPDILDLGAAGSAQVLSAPAVAVRGVAGLLARKLPDVVSCSGVGGRDAALARCVLLRLNTD